ncbi:redox-sensitive transcriptional activator SoxR [Microbacterium sp. NPDC089698]|uniref:redox-sensitive transcriptional activator SoxR n=1 Tax=Microbacterium sp. NPDC089698 TaxID=3364200 RepID=UPI00381EA0BA
MKQRPTDLLTIGEVAQRSGVATSAIRFYEEQGLISSTRTTGNQRRYPRYVLRRIGIIVAARRFGVPLTEVADVFEELPEDRMPGKSDWRRISKNWHERLEAKRREIELLEEELVGCIGCGCLSLKTCFVLNPNDALAAEGAGPRRLEPGRAEDASASGDSVAD